MLTKIAKELRWEMSHRLPYHEGPCRNIHGHSYKLVVEIEGEPDDKAMVLDYYEIEKIFRPLLNRLDHAFMVNERDALMLEFLRANEFKYVEVPFYTTAENLVTYFLDEAGESFKKYPNIKNLMIRVFETEDAYAERKISLG
jgi:6-pyruvoyltetrahydropterin/6-carboxytetrahydropterin synthase